MGKVILDLCGGSGAWSKPYMDAGFMTHCITLPSYNVNDWWVVGDAIRFRKSNPRNDGMGFLEVPMSDIYGILAAPPCTQFSIARTRAKIPRDLQGGMATVEACMRVIWAVQAYQMGKLHFWALENPTGLLRRFLGRPQFSFKQWEYGGTRDKPTDIWGYFELPRKTVTVRPPLLPLWGLEHVQDGYDRAAVRAMTPLGFAEAFFKANK